MKTLMYPIPPEDDFPDEFCAIRQGSGEHWFYTPVGESASWMLFRAEYENAKLREQGARLFDKTLELGTENAKLRELLRDTLTTISWCTIDCCPSDSKKRELNARACELGIELNDCE